MNTSLIGRIVMHAELTDQRIGEPLTRAFTTMPELLHEHLIPYTCRHNYYYATCNPLTSTFIFRYAPCNVKPLVRGMVDRLCILELVPAIPLVHPFLGPPGADKARAASPAEVLGGEPGDGTA